MYFYLLTLKLNFIMRIFFLIWVIFALLFSFPFIYRIIVLLIRDVIISIFKKKKLEEEEIKYKDFNWIEKEIENDLEKFLLKNAREKNIKKKDLIEYLILQKRILLQKYKKERKITFFNTEDFSKIFIKVVENY